MLRGLFRRRKSATIAHPQIGERPAALPENTRVYAIGDIHGRADLLQTMHGLIRDDAAACGPEIDKIVVYLGDYVDRGYESRKVIDILLDQLLSGFRSVILKGNHDAWLRQFLDDPLIGPHWLRYGGDATLLSYGVRVELRADDPERVDEVRQKLAKLMPERHVVFLDNLELKFELGDYIFVHAGLRPGVALERQSEEDLIWIREPFLSYRGDFGKVVVHGHTAEDNVVIRNNRIGIDTGACWTGTLTCLVLEEGSHRILVAEPVRQS